MKPSESGASGAAERGVLAVTATIRIPLSEFTFTYSRSAGPGGQNVNKVSSKARLRWRVTESPNLPPDVKARFLTRYGSRITADGDFLVSSQRHRDQPRNVADCLEKLRALLEAAARPPLKRKKTRPTAGSRRRRLADKRRRSEAKERRRAPPSND